MASLALRLPVFIASPFGLDEERDCAERVVREQAEELWRHGLHLYPVRWELHVGPGVGPIQTTIDQLLGDAELAVVLLDGRMGKGTLHELEKIVRMVNRGRADNAFVYVRDRALAAQVQSEHGVYPWPFTTNQDLEDNLRKHLQQFLARWIPIPAIIKATLLEDAPQAPGVFNAAAVLEKMRRHYDAKDRATVQELGRLAVDRYQRRGPGGLGLPLQDISLPSQRIEQLEQTVEVTTAPLRRVGAQLFFSDELWYYLFCGYGLVDAIKEENIDAVRAAAYVNPVHQFLRVLGGDDRVALAKVLSAWLKGEGRTRHAPVVRNFAAYELGMLEITDAIQDLAEALRNDDDPSVKLYCVTSLGKMRARACLSQLVDLWQTSNDTMMRSTIGQAICRIIGVANYPL